MKEGKEVLWSFCQAHMHQRSDIDLLLMPLDAFFARGACGRYTFSPEAQPDGMLLRTMMAVTGWRLVTNVNFTRQQCRPAEHHSDCEACFGVTELERSIGELTKSSLQERYIRPLKDELGRVAYREMSEVFMRTLGEPVWHSFECASWQDFGYDLKLGVRALVLMALFSFIGHSLSGHTKETQELSALLSVLLHCIPYGRATDDQGSLLTIVE